MIPPDPISQALEWLATVEAVSVSVEAAGDWAVRFDPPDGVKFNTVLKGACWVWTEGATPIRLQAGDGFMLTRGMAFYLASDPAVRPDAPGLRYEWTDDGIGRFNGGGAFALLGGRFRFTREGARFLFAQLPPLIVVPSLTAASQSLRWLLEALQGEQTEPRPGGALKAEMLGKLMLVEFLRAHLMDASQGRAGWLYALNEPGLRRALEAIHAAPGHRWQVAELARLGGMSRSSFAKNFRRATGTGPADYASAWRMVVAADRLLAPGARLLDVALDLGFDTESAFSNAFRRRYGAAPGRWAKAARAR